MNGRACVRGFSLIELAVVLLIIGLLIGGGLVALQTSTERERRANQQRQLEQVREALYGFAMSRGHLPCPDTDYPPNGEENRPAAACSGAEGALPWVTLGLGRQDAWGNPLRYRVSTDYADVPPVGDSAFGFGDSGDITVLDEDGVNLATFVPAIVVSYGPQGNQVWADDFFTCPTAAEGFSADARANCDQDAEFVDAGFRGADVDGGFQHMLTWLSDATLKARMVDAGRLP